MLRVHLGVTNTENVLLCIYLVHALRNAKLFASHWSLASFLGNDLQSPTAQAPGLNRARSCHATRPLGVKTPKPSPMVAPRDGCSRRKGKKAIRSDKHFHNGPPSTNTSCKGGKQKWSVPRFPKDGRPWLQSDEGHLHSAKIGQQRLGLNCAKRGTLN